jgi:hypothetical protein
MSRIVFRGGPGATTSSQRLKPSIRSESSRSLPRWLLRVELRLAAATRVSREHGESKPQANRSHPEPGRRTSQRRVLGVSSSDIFKRKDSQVRAASLVLPGGWLMRCNADRE